MAPLSSPEALTLSSLHERYDVFSNERFADPLKLQLSKLVSAPSSRRKVRFNREHNTVINPQREYYTDEDVQIKWWSADDLHDMRQQARTLSTLLRRNAKFQDCVLTTAHRKITLMLASDFHSLIKLSPSSPDQDLAMWCSEEDGRRGLERFASKVYSAFRRSDVNNTRRAVISEQSRQRFQQQLNPEAIAQIARDCSRRARSFAQFFGGADASQTTKKRDEALVQREPNRRAPPRKRSKIFHTIDEMVAVA